MSQRLYIFNPDHDLALGNGDENFNPPESARLFAADLACLPLWYALPGSAVCVSEEDAEWLEYMQRLFPRLRDIAVVQSPAEVGLESVHPWGWNASVRKSLLGQEISPRLLPDDARLENIRRLSHRSTAVRAMEFLHEDIRLRGILPRAARVLSDDEALAFALKYPCVVLKAPWSGSGKGLRWINGSLTESIEGWCRNIVKSQGCVVAEEVYDKVQDFAMEYHCTGGKASFAGYSLFHTAHGVYKGNELLSDEAIFRKLTQWIPAADLLAVRERLLMYIDNEIATCYDGFLGVDMFVYRQGETRKLHPCVEINLRMTMGMVARLFFDWFVPPEATGNFYIDHFSTAETLMADHGQRLIKSPLVVTVDRITKGYLSLTPVSGHSRYRVRIEIQ